jgi:hypothetical protein
MSENKNTAVFGIYATLAGVDNATYSLLDAGFFAPSISVLLPENIGSHQIGTEKATKAPEGAAAGASSGAILGGALGLLGGAWSSCHPGRWPATRGGANRRDPRWHGRGRHRGRFRRSADWLGHPGV